jgi:P27 family predicted phage terminase small subunit
MKGRKPKPTALKVLEGNPGKRPLPTNEPKPAPLAPKHPAWLHRDAKKEWKRVAPQLERLGLLTSLDMAALAGYCQAYARYKEAEEFLNKHGTTYTVWERDQDGAIKYDDSGEPILRQMHSWPQVQIAHKSLQQIRLFCVEFGFTPSSRGRISVPGAQDSDDGMDALLSGVTKKCISTK